MFSIANTNIDNENRRVGKVKFTFDPPVRGEEDFHPEPVLSYLEEQFPQFSFINAKFKIGKYDGYIKDFSPTRLRHPVILCDYISSYTFIFLYSEEIDPLQLQLLLSCQTKCNRNYSTVQVKV